MRVSCGQTCYGKDIQDKFLGAFISLTAALVAILLGKRVGVGGIEAYQRTECGMMHFGEFGELGDECNHRETLDSSLVMSVDIITELGFSNENAQGIARRYRENDERMVRDMAKHRHDEKAYIGRAKEYVRALDELMRSDLK